MSPLSSWAWMVSSAGALVLAVALSACGGGGEQADLTERPISDSELAIMGVYEPDLPQGFAGFVRTADSGLKTNEQAAEMHPDPEEEAQDQEQFGQLSEYVRAYQPPGAATSAADGAAISLVSTVQLFQDAAGASGYMADDVADLEASIGKASNGSTLQQVERFKTASIGDESVGRRMSETIDEGGQQRSAYGTRISFRYGRLLLSVTVLRADDQDVSKEIEALTRGLEERIKVILSAEPVTSPTPSG